MKCFNHKILLYASLFPVIIYLVSCSHQNDVRKKTGSWSRAIFDRAYTDLEKEKNRSALSDSIELTVQKLIHRALERAPELKRNNFDLQLSKNQREQSASEKWPRLDLNTTLYMPLDGNVENFSDHVYGGLFIRYELMEAFFNPDSVAIADSYIEQANEQREMVRKRLTWDIIDCLLNIEYFKKALSIHDSNISTINEYLEITERLYEVHKVNTKLPLEWKANLREAQKARNRIQDNLDEANAHLRQIAWLQNYQNIVVTDVDKISSLLDHSDVETAINKDTLCVAFENRHDIRIAEIELFQAEMDIIKAKHGRLPKLSLGLGVGSNSAYGNWEDQSLVSRLSITFPLLDGGDNDRRVKKSVIQRDRKRQKIVDLVHRVFFELEDAERQVMITRKSLDDAKAWYTEQKKWMAGQKALLTLNRIEQVEILTSQLAVNKAELECYRTTHSFHQANIQWYKAISKCWGE